jgi:putative endonuclease
VANRAANVGVTSNLINRAIEHRDGGFDGFTKRYQLKHLVWYGVFGDALDAITFEKKLKRCAEIGSSG